LGAACVDSGMSIEFPSVDGELTLEVNGREDVIRLRAVGSFDDPVDLSAAEARELARQLLELAERIG
jgi:hypothetical protein